MKVVVLLGLGAVVAACSTEPYPPYNRLESLRLLAIAADPAAPGPDETTTLSPLVYTPPGAAAVSYQWSWCPFSGSANDGYPCLVSEEELASQLGEFGLEAPPYDLGTAETAQFTNDLWFALAILCAGGPDAPPINCEGGFPLQIRLVATSGDERVEAVDTLRLRVDTTTPPNGNPSVSKLFVESQGALTQLGLLDSVELPRREETRIVADVLEADAEHFTSVGEDGEPVDETERLIVSWFVESGATRTQRTSFISGEVAVDVTRENFWTPALEADYPRDTSELIVVIRDSRGGVGWIRGQVGLAGDE